MISYTVDNVVSNRQYFGLSSDTKPVNKDVNNSDVFYEMNTGKVFMFDEDNQVWLEQ